MYVRTRWLQAGRSRVRFPMVSLKFFHYRNPSGRTRALGPTQSVTKMSTSNISWGDKGGRCVGLTHHLHFQIFIASTSCNPQGLYKKCFLCLLRMCIRRKDNGRLDGLSAMKLYMRIGGVPPPIYNLSATKPVKPVWGLCSRAKFLALHRVRTSNHPAHRLSLLFIRSVV